MTGFWKKAFIPSLILLWATNYYMEVRKLPEKNYVMIQPVFILLVLFYVINMVIDYREHKRNRAKERSEGLDDAGAPKREILFSPASRLVAVFSLLLLAVFLIEPLGFVLTIPLLTGSILWVMDVRKAAPLVLIPIVLTGVVFIVFGMLLGVPLPLGLLKGMGLVR